MKKLLATTAFVALMAASGSAFAVDETTYTVTGENQAACQVTNSEDAKTWAYSELFQHGAPMVSAVVPGATVATISCNAERTKFGIKSRNHGMTLDGALWGGSSEGRVNYIATAKLMTEETDEIVTADLDYTGEHILSDGLIPTSQALTLHLRTVTSSTMLKPGQYTDVLEFKIEPIN